MDAHTFGAGDHSGHPPGAGAHPDAHFSTQKDLALLEQAQAAAQHVAGAPLPTTAQGDDGPAAKRLKAGDGSVAAAPAADPAAVLAASGAVAGLDPSLLVHLTPEQLAVLQQDAAGGAGVAVFTPEMLVAAMQGGAGGVGPDGQPLQMQLPMLGDLGAGAGFPAAAAADPAALGLPGLDVSILQSFTPEQLQAFIQSPTMAPFIVPGGFILPGAAAPAPAGTFKNWWDERDEAELMRMVSDPGYRAEKTGCEELDWARLEAYFNRSENALRKKFWALSKSAGGDPGAYGVDTPPAEPLGLDAAAMASAAAAMAAAAAVAPPPPGPAHAPGPLPPGRSRAERKNWTEEETREMIRIVSDSQYRTAEGLQDPGEEDVAFDRLAARFGCAVQTAKRKYRHLQEQAAANGGVVPEKRKREHYRKSVPYRWMIVSALSKMPGFEGTAPQIFEKIEADPELAGQLDCRIMPGTKHVPRWKIQIRKVLSADAIFVNSQQKQKHETVWRLDPVALQDANAERQRQRAGVPPISLGAEEAGPAAAVAVAASEAAMAAALGHHLPPMAAAGLGLAEQTMAVLSQQQHLMLGMQPGQVLAIDPQQLQFMGLPEGTLLDPAALAAMVAPGAAAGAEAAVDPAAAAQHAEGNGALTEEQAASAAAAVAMALGHHGGEVAEVDAAAMAAWAAHHHQAAQHHAHDAAAHQHALEQHAAAAAEAPSAEHAA